MERVRTPQLTRALVFGVTMGLLTTTIPRAAAASKQAPVFRLQLFSGATLSSEELKGKVVVIRFLASW